MTEVLGYNYNDGGLNNQKLALFGLFLTGLKTKKPIVLPNMNIKNISANTNTPIPLNDVFEISYIIEFAKKHNIVLVDIDQNTLKVGGLDYFHTGMEQYTHVALSPNNPLLEFTLEFFSRLRPILRTSYLMKKLKEDIFGKHKVAISAQFRIEPDWELHSAGFLRATVNGPEDYLISCDRIAEKIAKTLSTRREILVLCDEAAISIPKSDIRSSCRSKTGVKLIWKSDFLTQFELNKLNPLELSLIDFELALNSRHFVGLSRSTFSNMCTFEKFISTGKSDRTDYIYNKVGPQLSLRTDNGGQFDPRYATK